MCCLKNKWTQVSIEGVLNIKVLGLCIKYRTELYESVLVKNYNWLKIQEEERRPEWMNLGNTEQVWINFLSIC